MISPTVFDRRAGAAPPLPVRAGPDVDGCFAGVGIWGCSAERVDTVNPAGG
jgi:hypothetical protein